MRSDRLYIIDHVPHLLLIGKLTRKKMKKNPSKSPRSRQRIFNPFSRQNQLQLWTLLPSDGRLHISCVQCQNCLLPCLCSEPPLSSKLEHLIATCMPHNIVQLATMHTLETGARKQRPAGAVASIKIFHFSTAGLFLSIGTSTTIAGCPLNTAALQNSVSPTASVP